MSTDADLLRRYTEDRSEPAFAEIVQRHLNLVYFAALRQVGGDTHRAQEVAQSVFTDLARKAATLTGRATLTGWLHTSTRFAAAKARRADFSRQQYELEASTMNALLSDPDPAAEWERLRPMIDDALHELDDRDRDAVLLRFFEGRPFADIGAALRLSDDAARMRVERALDKLRAALARRGVTSTSASRPFLPTKSVPRRRPASPPRSPPRLSRLVRVAPPSPAPDFL
jgi:RNA polymerase sigma factor (sigma-70 family)